MADVSIIAPGRWGFSRIVANVGGWTTDAMQDQLAPQIEAHYPPLVAGTYTVPYALVRLVGPVGTPANNDTVLLPRDLDLSELTLGDLTAGQRNAVRNFLESTYVAYQFTDWDGTLVNKAGLAATVQTYTNATTLRQVLRDVYRYLGHSLDRPRPALMETHNTEYLDTFATDPYATPRWTNESGTHVWDSGNSELDMSLAVGGPGARYSVNGPGSIEHESQVTAVENHSMGDAGVGPGVRMHNTGTDDWYTLWYDAGTTLYLGRWNAGVRTNLTTFSFTYTNGNFVTARMAAAGTAGSNVALSMWRNHDGASKPADPGWYGADGTPDHTYTDTSVDRLDDSAHAHCGITGRGQGVDYDTRCCFWKSRAISDRGGAGTNPKGPLSNPLAGPFGGPI